MNKYIGKPTDIPKMPYYILPCSFEWIGDVGKLITCIETWADAHENIIYTCDKDICRITFSLLDDTFGNYRTYCSFTLLITKDSDSKDRYCIEFNRLSDYGVIYSKYVTQLIEHIEKTFKIKLGEFILNRDFPKDGIPLIEDDCSYDALLSSPRQHNINYNFLQLHQTDKHKLLKILVDMMDSLQVDEKYKETFKKEEFQTQFNKYAEVMSKYNRTLKLACDEIKEIIGN